MRIWPRSLAGADEFLDYFQGTDHVLGAVWFGKTGFAIRSAQPCLAHVCRGIEDARAITLWPLLGNIGAQPSLGQPNVQDRKIGFVTLTECDRLVDGATDAAHLIVVVDKDLLQHVGHVEIVFGDNYLWHLGVGLTFWREGRVA